MSSLLSEAEDIYTNSLVFDEEIIRLRLAKLNTNLQNVDISSQDQLKISTIVLKTEYALHEKNNQKPIESDTKIEKSSMNSALNELNMLSSELHVNKHDLYEKQQLDTGEDVATMAAAIKQNALLFQQKLDSDADLVSTTTDSIHNTAGGMARVGQVLNKYRKTSQIGWSFYLFASIFILAVATVGWSLVMTIPKW